MSPEMVGDYNWGVMGSTWSTINKEIYGQVEFFVFFFSSSLIKLVTLVVR